jgi:hypothetical protein
VNVGERPKHDAFPAIVGIEEPVRSGNRVGPGDVARAGRSGGNGDAAGCPDAIDRTTPAAGKQDGSVLAPRPARGMAGVGEVTRRAAPPG